MSGLGLKVGGNIKAVVTYIQSICGQLPNIKYFLYGGVEEGIARATGDRNYKYPLLWMEQPTVKISQNSAGLWTVSYEMGLNVLTNVSGNLDDELDSSDVCQGLMYKVIDLINKDARTRKVLMMSNDFELDEVDRNWANNHVGWRASFRLTFQAKALREI
jgi:hypothetical protein